MAIALATLANVPYLIGDAAIPKVYSTSPVFAYDWNAARVTTATIIGTGYSGRTAVTFTLNAGGDTIFLPFVANEIHSVYVPAAAYATGVRGFITANLSGCRIYIDKVVGTNDLVIYHANARATGAGDTDPLQMDQETRTRVRELDRLYGLAQAYWAAAAGARPALNLQSTRTLGVTTYLTRAVEAVKQEQAAGRQNVDIMAGTTVIGELTPGGWQIGWQTYGDTTYTGKTVHNLNMQVLKSDRLL